MDREKKAREKERARARNGEMLSLYWRALNALSPINALSLLRARAREFRL